MGRFDSGVKCYIKGRVTLEVSFPVDWRGNAEIACKHCEFFHRTTSKCGLNHHVVNFPEKYVGDHCPLVPVEEEEKENV